MRLKIEDILKRSHINFYMIYFVGIVGHFFSITRPLMLALTPPVLFITSVYALLRAWYGDGTRKKPFIIWLVAVFLVTMLLEILGVKFGIFFGQYQYGGVLGPALFGVPLIIGINWIVVVTGSSALIKKITSNPYAIASGAGLISLLFDFILEPAAIALGYWDWAGAIPLKNYATWFIVTFVFAGVYGKMNLCSRDRWTTHLLTAQFLFFIMIRTMMALGVL